MKINFKKFLICFILLLISVITFCYQTSRKKIFADNSDIFEINFSVQSDYQLLGYSKLFCYNGDNKFYTTNYGGSLIELSLLPICSYSLQNYDTTFLGWFDNFDEQVIRYNKDGFSDGQTSQIIPSTTYSDLLGNIKLSKNLTLYPKFSIQAIPSKISFVTSYNEVLITGKTSLFITNNTNKFYTNESCIEFVKNQDFPSATKTQMGFQFTFVGWVFEEDNSQSSILIDNYGNLKKSLEGYTDTDGNWIYNGNVILYPKFTFEAITLTISFDSFDENINLNGSTNIFVKYLGSKLFVDYSLQNEYKINNLPFKNIYGYQSIFDGWYSADNKCVIDASGNLKSQVGGYTNENQEWILSQNSTLYAHFVDIPKIFKITFEVDDQNAIVNGNTILYSKYNSNLFYVDSACTNMGSTPIVRKQKIGYNVKLNSWQINNIDVLNSNGVLLKSVKDISNEEGNFCIAEDIVLKANIIETPLTFSITFCANGEGETIIGNSKLYISYNEDVFYLENEKINKADLPSASKIIKGYDTVFLGFFESTNSYAQQIIMADNTLLDSKIFTDGKFDYLSSIQIYAKFELNPAILTINLSTDGTLSKNKIYTKFNDNRYFEDENCQNEITCPIPTKEVKGYNSIFDGYYLESSLQTLIIDKESNIQSSIINLTNSNAKWCFENEITLYSKFSYELKTIEINLHLFLTGGEILSDYTTLYIKYQTNICYKDKDCKIKFETLPNAIYSLKGYNTTFLGYFTLENGGIKIIDSNLSFASDVDGFTDSNSNLVYNQNLDLYAQFSLSKKVYAINFELIDNEGDSVSVNGLTKFYVEYETLKFFTDSDLKTPFESFPKVTKQKQGYNYTFYGWCIKDGDNLLKILDENNNFCKVDGYTSISNSDTILYYLDSNMLLIPCFVKEGSISKLHFSLVNNQGTLVGNDTYYCIFGNEKLFFDEECKNVVNQNDYPYAQNDVSGYSVSFNGWFTKEENGIKVINSARQTEQNVDGILNDYKWEFVNSYTLYANFSFVPKVYRLNFDAVNGYIDYGENLANMTLYVEYNSNVLYENEYLTKISHLMNAYQEINGYISKFLGWKLINGSEIVFIRDQKEFGVSVTDLTDENGNWIATEDKYFEAIYSDDSLICEINLKNDEGTILGDYTKFYVKYNDTKIYVDKYCSLEAKNFPKATKTLTGYDEIFDGYYDKTNSNINVIDKNGNAINFTMFYYNGWKITESIDLYPVFIEQPKVLKITFKNIINVSDEQNWIGYIVYNTSEIYQDKNLIEKFKIIEPQNAKKGYTENFLGWYIDSENKNSLIFTKNLILQSMQEYIENGKFIYENDLVVYSQFEYVKNIYCITFDSNGGIIEDNNQSQIYLYIIFDTNIFYTDVSCQNEYKINNLPTAKRAMKGYTVSFQGYSYQNNLIIENGQLKNIDNYIENNNWIIAADVIIKANYNFVANIYALTFNQNNEKGGKSLSEDKTLYITFNTNKFFKNKELTIPSNVPICENILNENLIFSGYYTKDNSWVIDENGNLIFSDMVNDYTKIINKIVCWNYDYDIELYAEYKEISNMFEINLDNKQNEYGKFYENKIIFGENESKNTYLDKFKNLKIEEEINKISLQNYDEIHYDFEFFGYYTQKYGQGDLVIDKNNLITNNVENILDNGIWVENSKITLYAYYIMTPKVFKITFNAVDTMAELSTTITDYYITYSFCDIYDKNKEIKDIPIATKRKENYKCSFVGYKTSDGVLVIEYDDKICNVIKNIENFTDENGNWILSSDITLFAYFDEELLTYDAYYYNYDNTIFEVVDLNFNDYLVLPSSNPTKIIEDSGKEYIFRGWNGYNYDKTTIMKENKYFYPIFEEFDKKEKNEENKEIFVESNSNFSKIYLGDISSDFVLKIQLENSSITFDKDAVNILMNNQSTLGDYIVIKLIEKGSNEISSKLQKNMQNQKIFNFILTQGDKEIVLGMGKIEIVVSYEEKIEIESLKGYLINEKLNSKNEIEILFNQQNKEINLTFNGINNCLFMIGNYDNSKDGLILKIVIIALCAVFAIAILISIIIVILKNISNKISDKKYKKKNKSKLQTQNFKRQEESFYENLQKNSLMKNNYYNENFDSETIQEKIKVKNKTKSSKPINYGKMILEEQKKKKEELRKQRNFEKAQQKKQKIYEKLEKQRQKKSYKK